MSAAIEISYIEKTEKERDPVIALANELVIENQTSFEEDGTLLTTLIKPMIKEIHDSCDPVCAATNTAHKSAT